MLLRPQGLVGARIFSIPQRKVLTPNDFDSLFAPKDRILAFQDTYQEYAKPFKWKFTREDLSELLTKLALEKAARIRHRKLRATGLGTLTIWNRHGQLLGSRAGLPIRSITVWKRTDPKYIRSACFCFG